MSLFLSTFTNKVDKKGRVSVPASFRAILASQNFNGIVAYDSFINPCVEACGMARIEKIHARIEELDPYSEEHDAFSSVVMGGSQQLGFDSEGRVMLPKAMMEAAGIEDQAVFVGKGETFEIWSPKAHEKHMAHAKKVAAEKRSKLRAARQNIGDEA